MCPCASTRAHSAIRRVQSADRFIIVAVDNVAAAFVAHAGGTPRGYDAVADYGATAHARETLHAAGTRVRIARGQCVADRTAADSLRRAGDSRGRRSRAVAGRAGEGSARQVDAALQTFATRTQDYNDPYVGLQRGFQQMDVADAHPWSRGEGVKVAIIDTGVDIQHPDLRGSIAAAANFVDADDAQFRRDRHGTEMAGVIAAVANNREGIVGIAPNARLLVFKACWQTNSDADAARCNSFTLARALTAAFDAHAQVVNLSLAGPDDPLLGDLIREGQHRGVLFVGAAPDPAADQGGLLHQAGVIEVAGAESHAAIDTVLYAPGREILTLLPGGHYDFASGASIATAQVSGVIALMLAKNPETVGCLSLSAAARYQFLAAERGRRQSRASMRALPW